MAFGARMEEDSKLTAGVDRRKGVEGDRLINMSERDDLRKLIQDLAIVRGRVVSVPDWKYKVAVFGLRHLPRSLTRRAARDTRGRIGHHDGVRSPDGGGQQTHSRS